MREVDARTDRLRQLSTNELERAITDKVTMSLELKFSRKQQQDAEVNELQYNKHKLLIYELDANKQRYIALEAKFAVAQHDRDKLIDTVAALNVDLNKGNDGES